MGIPPILASGLSGRRVDAKRAGMIIKTLIICVYQVHWQQRQARRLRSSELHAKTPRIATLRVVSGTP
jgi:hypothetical protein